MEWLDYAGVGVEINRLFAPLMETVLGLPVALGATLLFGFFRKELILVMATAALGVATLSELPMTSGQVIVFVVLFNKPFWRPQVLLILALGTLGYIAAGVLDASMSLQTRSRDVLLQVLLLPLSLPLVLPAAMAVSAYMFPELPPWSEVQSAVYLVLLYDLLMVSAGLFFYHYVVES